jgi:uncharacterized protein YdaU (DUF1376 family)
MSNRELPMMPWFPKEFAAATSTWSFAERSAYRALLDVQWEMGVLPVDNWRLAQAIGMPLADFESVWAQVSTKFEHVEGGVLNSRLEEHRVKSFQLKQGHSTGAEITNAKRAAKRGADRAAQHSTERAAKRVAQRSAQRLASVSPPSPSEDKKPLPNPSPSKHGEGPTSSRGNGSNPRRLGTSPRATGENPRAQHANPRARQNQSRRAWRTITGEIDRIAATGSLPTAERLTWADIKSDDPIALRAADSVGFRTIADRDKFTTSDLQDRFRDAYERHGGNGADAPDAAPIAAAAEPKP